MRFYIKLLLVTLLLNAFSVKSQCNINTTICQINGNSAGPFTFQNPSNNPSTCLDFINGNTANYAYIVLYITQTGNLDILIQGNNGGTGCLDVAIFNITDQPNPCASLSPATQISCNYVAPCVGCAEFGSGSLGCPAVINPGQVTAGTTLLILVEDYSNAQNSFTLTVGNSTNPPSAQTGIPDATIDPASTGPFCATDGLQQISAGNMGGTWSGPGMSANGMFNPAVAGPGVHTINYSIGVAPCNASATAQITVGSIEMSGLTVGTCQPGGVYSVSGNVNISHPPSTGQLIVEDCTGQQTVVASAPFSVGSYPFNISGLTANGAACDVHAYFTESACSHILNYTAPTCPVSCGITNFTATPSACDANNTYTLNGSLSFVNAPSTGTLIVSDCNGNSTTFNAPFTSPINYSFTSIPANGQACVVNAHFSADPTCSSTANYTAPAIPVVNAGPDVTICNGNSTPLTASGASEFVWSNSAGNTASVTVSPSSTTTYIVTGTTNGCSSTDQVTVTVSPDIVLTMSPDVAICQGQSTVLSVSGANNYVWESGLGTTSTLTVSPSTTTTYSVTGTDINNCIGTGQVVVTVNPNPTITAQDIGLCPSETETITAFGANNYTWSPATNLSSTTGQTVLFTPGTSTTYTITGTDANNCVGTTTVNAVVYAAPVIDAGIDVYECEGELITLTGSGSGTGGYYTWSSGVQDGAPFISPVGTTVYTVTGYNSNGCSATDSLTVNIEASPTVSFTATQDQFCQPVQATFTNTSTPGVNCLWIFDNGQTATGCNIPISQTFSNPGVFGASLQVETSNGCISSLYLDSMVFVDAMPIAAFKPNPSIFEISNPDVSFQNNSVGATSYIWDFGHNNATSTQTSPTYTYPSEVESYLVTLTAISSAGCIDTAQMYVRSEEDLIYYIPNSFTPDNDEYNQTFLPIFTSGFDIFDYQFMVFNRWGEMVFESYDVTIGWKGTYGADGTESICQEGVYTWKIEFKTIKNDERKMIVGHVNLIR